MRSLWLQEALARDGEDDAPPLRGDERADVCIVGGGYAGLWTALHLKELAAVGRRGPGRGRRLRRRRERAQRRLRPDVVAEVRDARQAGRRSRRRGASAARPRTRWARSARSAAANGDRRAATTRTATCGPRPTSAQRDDWAVHGRGAGALRRAPLRGAGARGGRRADRFGRAPRGRLRAIAARSSSRRCWPAGCGAWRMDRGVRVFERSPMTALDRAAGGPVVRTATGRLRAERVVLAMNAWAIRFAEIRRHVLVIGSDVVATAPVPERLREIGWTDGMAISDSRLLVNYYRTTDDGRIAFGKGGGRLAFGAWLGSAVRGSRPRGRDAAEEGLRRTYPTLADVPVTHRWTGSDRPHAERSADLRRPVAAPRGVLRRRILRQRRGSDVRGRAHPRIDGARARRRVGQRAGWSAVTPNAGRPNPSASPAAR